MVDANRCVGIVRYAAVGITSFVAVMLVLLGGVLSLLAGCSPVAIVLLSLGLTGSIVGFARAVLRMRREQ